MQIEKLFEVQSVTFEKTKNGNDLIVQAATGSGKTLSFVLPIMEKLIQRAEAGEYESYDSRGGWSKIVAKPKCLVVAPTRELAVQIGQVFDDYIRNMRRIEHEVPKSLRRINSVCCYGGDSMKKQINLLASGNSDIVIGTPGRLMAFLNDGNVTLDNLEILVLDEVDRMLNIGFKEDIQRILSYAKHFDVSKMQSKNRKQKRAEMRRIQAENLARPSPQVLLYSATCPPWVEQASNNLLSDNFEKLSLVDKNQEISGRNENVFHYAHACTKA